MRDIETVEVFERVAAEKHLAMCALVRDHVTMKSKRLYKGTSAIVQSALAEAWRHLDTADIEDADAMFRWLNAFVINKCNNVIKRVEVMVKHSDAITIETARRQFENPNFDDDVLRDLRPCLDELTADQTLIMSLKLSGVKHEDIGAELEPERSAQQISDEWKRTLKSLRACAENRGLVLEDA